MDSSSGGRGAEQLGHFRLLEGKGLREATDELGPSGTKHVQIEVAEIEAIYRAELSAL